MVVVWEVAHTVRIWESDRTALNKEREKSDHRVENAKKNPIVAEGLKKSSPGYLPCSCMFCKASTQTALTGRSEHQS